MCVCVCVFFFFFFYLEPRVLIVECVFVRGSDYRQTVPNHTEPPKGLLHSFEDVRFLLPASGFLGLGCEAYHRRVFYIYIRNYRDFIMRMP